jgi:hypothetical protein
VAVTSILGDAGTAVAGALQSTGVAVAAGVDPTTWALLWPAGGHVRPWRPTQAVRGRTPYLEYAVGQADFTNEVYQGGGLARIRISVAAVIRTTDHNTAEQQSAAIILTALDAIRGLGGGFAGQGDQVGELTKLKGYSDLWRREASIECVLDFSFNSRAVAPGATSFTNTIKGFQGTMTVNYGDGTLSMSIPTGFTVTMIQVTPTIAWNGTGAALSVYLDPDASVQMSPQLTDTTLATQEQGAITGATALRVVATPGAGATAGQAVVTITASSP